MGLRQRLLDTAVLAVWAGRRMALNSVRVLPGALRWFRPGRCVLCGGWGWVFWETGEHEECWLGIR